MVWNTSLRVRYGLRVPTRTMTFQRSILDLQKGTWFETPQIHGSGELLICRIVHGYCPLHIQHVAMLF